mmetsp:Transcript_12320/g.28462  ORF Transcript_12320/g.28462 Transcript_12320/m.28462 type:complete len:109 (-) Transcript_12320:131-457(-)
MSTAVMPTRPRVLAVYRQLLQQLRRFPHEVSSNFVEGQTRSSFHEVVREKMRSEFKSNKNVDALRTRELLDYAQREVDSLTSILSNTHLTKHPGPPVVKKLHPESVSE